jgi:cystathionine beta-lyase/cystathionine gamma-synthase
MERHSANALELAHWLETRPGVRLVRYPFLPSHPQHALARRQMKAGSGMVVFELDCAAERALGFCRRLRYFTLAESLGGVESLICHPPTMTHASIPVEVRHRVGIGDGLLRLSVGIEDVEDLRSDLEAGLKEVVG